MTDEDMTTTEAVALLDQLRHYDLAPDEHVMLDPESVRAVVLLVDDLQSFHGWLVRETVSAQRRLAEAERNRRGGTATRESERLATLEDARQMRQPFDVKFPETP